MRAAALGYAHELPKLAELLLQGRELLAAVHLPAHITLPGELRGHTYESLPLPMEKYCSLHVEENIFGFWHWYAIPSSSHL